MTLAEIVVQTAVRILFIVASILMAASMLPLKFHAAIIPVVAVGTTTLAAFFFPKPVYLGRPHFASLEPLVRPIIVAPPPLAAEAPRPLYNAAHNCAFNSLVHFLESDPTIAQWLRHPLDANIDMAAFENFLAGYQPPAQVIERFRDYVNEVPNPQPSIPTMFKTFIDQHVPEPAYDQAFRAFKINYNDLISIHEPLSRFFAEYDAAVQNNGVVRGSQNLRLTISRVSAIPNSQYVQIDAAEAMNAILGTLPNAQKTFIRETTRYNTNGLPAILGNPQAFIQQDERHGSIALSIPKNDQTPTLEKLIQNHCNDSEPFKRKGIDGKDRFYPATIERQFLEAPSVLRFHIKRFLNEPPPDSWLTRLKLKFWPKLPWNMVKKENPITAPEQLTITLANAEQRQYRLTSFIVHHGSSVESGHYTSARILNGQKYLMSDQQVTLADQPTWEQQLQQAYLLCYLPVQA